MNTHKQPIIKNKITGPAVIYGSFIVIVIGYINLGEPIAILLNGIFGLRLTTENTWLPIYISVFTLFALSILTTILNWQWFKKYWHVNAIIFIISGFLAAMILFNRN
jgi:hypothetical protein